MVSTPYAAVSARSKGSHNVNAKGTYTTNRKDKELCRGFQQGQCVNANPKKNPPTCDKDESKMHQCELCLSDRHGAWQCQPDSQQGNQVAKGRGGGKHKGKGKKGKGKGKGKW